MSVSRKLSKLAGFWPEQNAAIKAATGKWLKWLKENVEFAEKATGDCYTGHKENAQATAAKRQKFHERTGMPISESVVSADRP
jgi:hypothetical protein